MKLKSRGLGRKELIMDFREYEVTRDGDEVLVSGTITKPVHWDFSIRMSPDDIPGMLKVALSKATIGMFFRWLNPFKRRNKGEDEEGGVSGAAAKAGAASKGAAPASAAAGGAKAKDAKGADSPAVDKAEVKEGEPAVEGGDKEGTAA